MTRTLLTILLLSAATVRGVILTSDRVVPWQGNVGIPGGIPNRTTVFTTLSGLDTTGATDSTSAIQTALNSCPSNQVVVLPAGFIRINGSLFMKDGVVLRGQGMTNTVLRQFGIYPIRFNEDSSFELDQVITAGGTHGSTSVTLSSAGSYSVGMMGVVDQDNDLTLLNPNGTEGPGTSPTLERLYRRAAGHYVEITAKVGNVLTVEPPLAYNLSASLAPKLHVEVVSGNKTHVRYAGIENLTITNVASINSANDGISLWFRRAAYCWAKNVETRRSHRRAVQLRFSFRNQIEGCTFRDAGLIGSDQGYCVQQDFWSSGNLVQDNISSGMLNMVLMEYGSTYNAFAYNFYTNGASQAGSPSFQSPGFSAHGLHSGFNLLEGNVGSAYVADFIHGSGSHQTLFRNHFRGQSTDKSENELCVSLHKAHYFYNVIGNVLGNAIWTGSSNNFYESSPNIGFFSSVYTQPTIWWLGWREINCSFTSACSDVNVRNTLIRHGNWDSHTDSVNWNTSISDHNLPTSYVYASRPSYWGVNWPYPAIGSDLSPLVSTIPAQRRFLGISEGSGPSNPSTFTISIRSLNPGTGVLIAATTDNNGNGDGTTIFTRTYNDGTSVLLTAPATHLGVPFTKWQRDGVDWSTSASTSFSATSAFTFTAIYGTPTLPSSYLTAQGLTFHPP